MEARPVLLQIAGLRKYFPVRSFAGFARKHFVRAVDGVTFSVHDRETVAIVGESGCGKTTIAKLILLLETPTSGAILFQDADINRIRGSQLFDYRRAVQAVFQDPTSSLDPRMRIGAIIAEPLINGMSAVEKRALVGRLLARVGLDASLSSSFPHELSVGQRQRVAIARALAPSPRLIVLDEPASSLDVSIRTQIMNLLSDLQQEEGLSYLLISHDLATVRYLSHRVAVLYMGEIVEFDTTESLFTHPLHPYTTALLAAARPAQRGESSDAVVWQGEVPSPISPPSGCRFRTRCPHVFERCARDAPHLHDMGAGHRVACHLYDDASPRRKEG